MSKREKLFGRLAKLLALAKSPNTHEAASAKAKANKLMSENGLTEADVVEHEAGLYELPMGAEGFNAIWKFSLVTAAARYHGCEALGLAKGRKRKVRIVGDKPDVERAAALFEDLLAVMRKLERFVAGRIAEDDTAVFGASVRECVDSFRRGVATGLIEKLIRVRPERFGKGSPARPPASSPSSKSCGSFGGSVFRPKPPAATSELIVSEGSKKEDQHEKIHRKYRPQSRPLDLDDAASSYWYTLGYEATSQIEVVDEAPIQKSAVDTTPIEV